MLKLGNDGIWQVLSPSTGDTHSKHRTRGCLQADTAVLCHRLLPLAHNLTFFCLKLGAFTLLLIRHDNDVVAIKRHPCLAE